MSTIRPATNSVDPHDGSPETSRHQSPTQQMGSRMTTIIDADAAIVPAGLDQLAAAPGTDPCDIAEAAMPDLVLGDLATPDAEWVHAHTITCRYCAGILESLEDVTSTLESSNTSLIYALEERERPSVASRLGLSDARYGFTETPVGDVLIAISEVGVLEVSFVQGGGPYEALREIEERGFLVYERNDAVSPVVEELSEYFHHRRYDFSLPVDLTGVTEFTKSVLNATQGIPYGKVRTYGDVAGAIGKPRASRAVGNALGRNPIPVIIPCHRVILASGAMGWYTGGPDIKRALLGIEGVVWQHAQQPQLPL